MPLSHNFKTKLFRWISCSSGKFDSHAGCSRQARHCALVIGISFSVADLDSPSVIVLSFVSFAAIEFDFFANGEDIADSDSTVDDDVVVATASFVVVVFRLTWTLPWSADDAAATPNDAAADNDDDAGVSDGVGSGGDACDEGGSGRLQKARSVMDDIIGNYWQLKIKNKAQLCCC